MLTILYPKSFILLLYTKNHSRITKHGESLDGLEGKTMLLLYSPRVYSIGSFLS